MFFCSSCCYCQCQSFYRLYLIIFMCSFSYYSIVVFIVSPIQDFSSNERHIARLIRQIRGTKDNVRWRSGFYRLSVKEWSKSQYSCSFYVLSIMFCRSKATEILKIFGDPSCPQSISIAMFAKKVRCSSLILALYNSKYHISAGTRSLCSLAALKHSISI